MSSPSSLANYFLKLIMNMSESQGLSTDLELSDPPILKKTHHIYEVKERQIYSLLYLTNV